jgi:hypothetical protein
MGHPLEAFGVYHMDWHNELTLNNKW